MKKPILLLALTLILSNLSSGQNILILRNGDKMNGKLDGFKNDTIIFKIQGNKLKFKTSNIVSIYFDEKLASAELHMTSNTNEIKPVIQGSIFGVVTYFFNKNYGDKPDVGAEVYIADSTKITDFNLAIIDSFHYASFYRNIYLEYKSMGKVPDEIMERIKKYNPEDKLAFDSLDKSAAANIFKLKFAKDVVKTVVDGSGNYSVKLKPGTYYVYIRSNNREGVSITESTGKVVCEKVIVKGGEDTNMSCNFGIR